MIRQKEEVLNNTYLNKLFDCVRIVNPINNDIVNSKDIPVKHSSKCYSIWNRNKSCENCISMRAYNENSTIVKIESRDNRVYWIMATPININESNLVIETIKDITDCKIIDGVNAKTTEEIQEDIKKMNKLIVTDELTQCYNRRYINEKLIVDMDTSRMYNTNLSIAMIDIDYFKKINDTYNHLVGDYVLKEVVRIVRSNIRSEQDWIARYGGEEFLIVFNNTSSEVAIKLCNRIRLAIKENVFKYNDIDIRITVSLGIQTLNHNIESIEDFIERVDKKLYEAKCNGRDLVMI